MTPHLLNRPADPRVDLNPVNSSNSTASIFLGGARKSWMLNGPRPPLPNTNRNTNTPPNHTTCISRPATTKTAPPPSSSSSPSAPTPTPPSETRPPGMRASSTHLRGNLVSFNNNNNNASGSSTAFVTLSSATNHNNNNNNNNNPPAPLPQVPSLPFAASVSSEESQQQLQKHHQVQHQQQQSGASLPSPDPTIPPRSHASPVSAIERNVSTVSSPSAAAIPSPPNREPPLAPQLLRQNAPSVGAPPVSLNAHHQRGSNLQLLPGQGAPWAVNPRPLPPVSIIASPAHTPPLRHAPSPSEAVPIVYPAQARLPAIDDSFFAHAKAVLDSYSVAARSGMHLSETVESPRLQLLLNACVERDLVYLVLHQVYCLRDFAPSEFNKLPGITPKQVQGLSTVRHLLVENHRVSGDFLKWCVHFPRPFQAMLHVPAYREALSRVCLILAGFADQWAAFDQLVRSRGYPPLVDEIVVRLCIMSPVLQFNVFLALCRRIPEIRIVNKLQDIFFNNLGNFKRRYMQQIPHDQMQRENEEIVTAYITIIRAQKETVPHPPVTRDPVVATQFHVSQPSFPSSSQPGSASVPVPHPPQPHTQRSSQAPAANFMAPPVRSSSIATVPRHPQPPSTQSALQQHHAVPQMFTSITSTTPMMASAPSHRAQHDLSQVYQVQQPPVRQPLAGNAMVTQNPHISVQRPVDRRTAVAAAGAAANFRPPVIQTSHRNSRLLPPPGVPPVRNTRPDPNELALHQAHLRDPVNRLISSHAKEREEAKLFSYLASFSVAPQLLGQTDCVFQWDFALSNSDLGHLPALANQGNGRRMLRTLTEGSMVYHLRCIKVGPSATEVSEHSWCIAETVWPCAAYVFINNVELFPRRKIHNGRDVPLDITPYLQEGMNRVTVHLIRNPAEEKTQTYAMAVEVLTHSSYSSVKGLAGSLSASESREKILKRLSCSPDDDGHDDNAELKIISDDLMVTLIDPFTARLFTVPVRGHHCQHPECFDHETFLQTRALKSGDISIETDWRCPICHQDARPQSLVVDGYLAEICADLVRTNRCDGARALHIKADGSWELKTDTDISEHETPQPSRMMSKRKSNVMDSISAPVSQRPKIDPTPRVPGRLTHAIQPPSIIVLD